MHGKARDDPLYRARMKAKRLLDGPRDHSALDRIWDIVSSIPRGKVATYGSVARAAGLPGRARLVGFALRTAPQDMNLPWHRVLGAGGRIVFARSSREYREQAKRLCSEGTLVQKGRVSPVALIATEDW
jgi:methylated-DNA-protein-cysteine methyltransferase related protein